MRLGILADTHDHASRAARAAALLAARGAGALVHCGDITTPAVVVAVAAAGLPAYFAFGNNDHDVRGLSAAIARSDLATALGRGGSLRLGGRTIAVTHGDSPAEVRKLLAESPDYLLVGHSHKQRDERRGKTRVINPGALHRAKPWSVALLDLAADQLEFLPLAADD